MFCKKLACMFPGQAISTRVNFNGKLSDLCEFEQGGSKLPMQNYYQLSIWLHVRECSLLWQLVSKKLWKIRTAYSTFTNRSSCNEFIVQNSRNSRSEQAKI